MIIDYSHASNTIDHASLCKKLELYMVKHGISFAII